MGLPWVRVDADFVQNPKVLGLITLNRWRSITVYIGALGWAQAQGTDGHIPVAALPLIHATRREAEHLVDAGLWHPSDIGGGWIVNDWADYQPNAGHYGNSREKSAKGNCIRWHGHACGCWKDPSRDPIGTPNVGLHGTKRNYTNTGHLR